MAFWRKRQKWQKWRKWGNSRESRKRAGESLKSPPAALVITRAAANGASIKELSQETYRVLQPAFAPRAQYFAVWLRSSDGPNSELADCFHGQTWFDGLENAWQQLEPCDEALAFPSFVWESNSAIEKDLPLSSPLHSDVFASELRRGIWIPIRVAQELHGLIIAASSSRSIVFPRIEMETAAAALALALELHAATANAQQLRVDAAETRRIFANISAGASLAQNLQDISDGAVQRDAAGRKGARFVAIGLMPDDAALPGQVPQARFVSFAGDPLLARAPNCEPISLLCRRALESKSVVGDSVVVVSLNLKRTQVVAIPLLVSGQAKGILVAGFDQANAGLGSLERLQTRADLAAAALASSGARSLREASHRSSNFFLQHASDAVFQIDLRREIILASAAGKALLHPLQPSANGQRHILSGPSSLGSIAQIFNHLEWPRISVWLDRALERGADPDKAFATKLLSGREVHLYAVATTSTNLELLVQANSSKLIARRETDNALTHSSAESANSARLLTELRTVIDWIDQGVLIFSADEGIRAVNPRFAQLFGLSELEMGTASTLPELIEAVSPHVSEPNGFSDLWRASARGAERSLHQEIQVLQPVRRLLERVSHPVFDASGTRIGRVEIYRDLSAHQLVQSKLQESDRLASLGQHVSGIAHELSSPLTTVLGYAQRLLRIAKDSPFREDLERIFSEANRASSILRQLLTSTPRAALDRLSMDLNALILRTVDVQRFQLTSEKIHLELDLVSTLPKVLADSGQVQQILTNLLSNARHALLCETPGGVIFIRTRAADADRVLLEVADSGPGIPEAHRHRIFDPFFTTKPAGIGTGLGLSIVMGLARQNGGNIRLQSSPGQGATFIVDLPAAPAITEISIPVLPAAISTLPVSKSGTRVLVVEDEPTVAQLIADMLSDLGYLAEVFHESRRALISALNRDYALVICDMKMPALDGQHFYRALAEVDSPLISRFLFVTGDVLGLSTQEFLRTHRLPHIAKPFRLEEFAEQVAAVIALPSSVAQAARRPTPALKLKNSRTHG